LLRREACARGEPAAQGCAPRPQALLDAAGSPRAHASRRNKRCFFSSNSSSYSPTPSLRD
jgi:hypothetical protein